MTPSMREDSGHSSNLVAVDLCHAAGAQRLALFHHEPRYTDADISRCTSRRCTTRRCARRAAEARGDLRL
ncbi:MAG: hypothetical protein WDM85_12640 [Caulobacteraceae bacterium]